MKTRSMVIIVALMMFSVSANANVLKESGSVCFSDNDNDGLSESMTFPSAGHEIFSIYPDDPLGEYIGGFDANCNLPLSYVEFADLDLTGEVTYAADGACLNGDMPLVKTTIEDAYAMYLLDDTTCTYNKVMEMDIAIRGSVLQAWCPDAKYAFEFNNAEINNYINSPLLDFFASQPETPLSWGFIDLRSANGNPSDIGGAIRTGQSFCVEAEFTYFPGEVCGSCEDCGVESNGRMMTAMAKHHYLRGRAAVCSDPTGEGVLCDMPIRLPASASHHTTDIMMKTSKLQVSALLPDFAKLGLQAMPATPEDLVYITNATDIIAMDHFKSGKVNGSFLVMETNDKVYEHTKTVCDRASGSVLQHIIELRVNGMIFPVAVLYDTNKKERDFAIAFVISENKIYSRWQLRDYPQFKDANVYNLQIWSPTLAETERLLKAELAHLEDLLGTLSYDEASPETRISKSYFMAGDKNGLDISFFIGGRNYDGLTLQGEYWPEGNASESKTFTIKADTGRILDKLPPFLDAQVKLVDDNGNVMDEVYLTDGAYTAFNDHEFNDGTSKTVDEINQNCERNLLSGEDDLIITGCASNMGSVDKYTVVTRTLNGAKAPYNFNDYQEIAFEYRSETELVFCTESKSLYGQSQPCVTLPATNGWSQAAIKIEDINIYQTDKQADLENIVALSWNAWNANSANGNLNVDYAVQGVVIRAKKTDAALSSNSVPETLVGCNQSDASSSAMLLMLAMLATAMLRRKQED